jgi:hypothetical protein
MAWIKSGRSRDPAHNRWDWILTPSLAELDPTLPAEIANHNPLARHWRAGEDTSTPSTSASLLPR